MKKENVCTIHETFIFMFTLKVYKPPRDQVPVTVSKLFNNVYFQIHRVWLVCLVIFELVSENGKENYELLLFHLATNSSQNSGNRSQ